MLLAPELWRNDASLETKLEHAVATPFSDPVEPVQNQILWLTVVLHAQIDEVVPLRPVKAESLEWIAVLFFVLVWIVEVDEELGLVSCFVDFVHECCVLRSVRLPFNLLDHVSHFDFVRVGVKCHFLLELSDQAAKQLDMHQLLVL
jgi:hypothetical protein